MKPHLLNSIPETLRCIAILRVIHRNSWEGIMNTKELCKHENLLISSKELPPVDFGALILINFSGYLNLQWIENRFPDLLLRVYPSKS